MFKNICIPQLYREVFKHRLFKPLLVEQGSQENILVLCVLPFAIGISISAQFLRGIITNVSAFHEAQNT